ncbi:MAG: antibiotic biosynthesis monooxygenase [Rhodanobacter sp.]|nr:MAG: antibiotic biosynthesis monooxygenase [Rhodanobacter sp.]
MSLHVFASLIPKVEHRASVEAALRDMVRASRAEPGNRCYDLFTDADGGAGFHVLETYQDQAALEAHRHSEHYRDYRAKVGDWLVEPPVVKVLRALDAINV